LRLIPYETLVGVIMAVGSVVAYMIMG
jgi:hypothetical protein